MLFPAITLGPQGSMAADKFYLKLDKTQAKVDISWYKFEYYKS